MIKKLFVGTFGVALNVIIYILVILLAIRVITWSYDFAYEVFGDRPVAEASEEIVPVQISDGASTNEIAAILDKKGLIRYLMDGTSQQKRDFLHQLLKTLYEE